MEAHEKLMKDMYLVLKNGFREIKKSLDGIERAVLKCKNGDLDCDFEHEDDVLEASDNVDFVQGIDAEEDKLSAGWHILDTSDESYPDENEGWVFVKIANKEGKLLDIPCMMRFDYTDKQWKLPKYLTMTGPDYYVVGWKKIKY